MSRDALRGLVREAVASRDWLGPWPLDAREIADVLRHVLARDAALAARFEAGDRSAEGPLHDAVVEALASLFLPR